MMRCNVADEIRVGSRVETPQGWVGYVRSLDEDDWGRIYVELSQIAECRFKPRDLWVISAPRISPAEPQPKYRVGQRVRQRSTGEQGIVGEILHPISYKVKWPDGGENQYGEDDLEAVPAICPTCGGKVGDE